jgi:hypothetical protein
MGYDFPTAIADLLDNSLVAGSTLVTIDVEFNGDDSWVRIADNGIGMNDSQLIEAMRYGSQRIYESEDDLGKFGLGLKTASISQCRRLSVASRSAPSRKTIHAYCWDLDHVEKTDKWEIEAVDTHNLSLVLDGNLAVGTGTVVFWQRLDRILGYRHPYGDAAKTRLATMCRDLEEHLAMVFHRFLTGELSHRGRLTIILNGHHIKPWDPFSRRETRTQRLEKREVSLENEGISGTVIIQPYVLPAQTEYSSKEAFNRASGPRKWNRQQGFYIYRANRLIQSGGWSGLRTFDEHTKLARVALDFSPNLDDAFKINVSKMRVQLPVQIKEQIELALRPVINLAQKTYRKKNKTPEIPNTPSASSQERHNQKTNVDVGVKIMTIDQLEAALYRIADSTEKPIVKRLFSRFRKTNSQ